MHDTLITTKDWNFFCNLHVQCIYLTHGLYTMYHTFHVNQARIQRGPGFFTLPPPPLWDLSKVGSWEEVWLVEEGVQQSSLPCYYQFLWHASLVIITCITYSRVQCLVWNGHPFFYISLIKIMKWIQLTIPCFMIGHFHFLLSKITRFNTI